MPIFLKRMKEYTYEKLNNNEPPKPSKTTFNWQTGIPQHAVDAVRILALYQLSTIDTVTHGIQLTSDVHHDRREVDSTTSICGSASPEIDAAWAELLRGEFPAITDQEATPYKPYIQKFPDTGNYHFELDVFHSLHCLNYIRMYLDKDYYSAHLEHHDSFLRNSSHMPDNWGQVHLHHCLEQVVQSVICHADLSPVPMYGWKGVPVFLGVGQTHTCRRWESIREWMDVRNEVRKPLEEE
ncbi:hypothetical protein AFLA_011742 [Aspergillus flavus NRRL3357]|nr:hypothetical protein AFLA_011742 [Aspergillus flavus NRRL3357]